MGRLAWYRWPRGERDDRAQQQKGEKSVNVAGETAPAGRSLSPGSDAIDRNPQRQRRGTLPSSPPTSHRHAQ